MKPKHERNEKIRQQRAAGRKLRELAAEHGLCKQRISTIVHTPDASPSIWTQLLVDDLVRLRADGYTYTAIARTLGLTRNQVIGKAWRLGLRR